jgi:hypothetical protein
MVRVPDAPGIGAAVNREVAERYEVKAEQEPK